MVSISKSVYTDALDAIVNEYNNTYHRTITMKPVDVKDNTYIDLLWSYCALMIKILYLKSVIILEFANTKKFLLKDTHQIGLKKFL